MSQPFNQFDEHQSPGKLDTESGEFWMKSPWQAEDHNLSAYERNGVLLNTGNGQFVDISRISGADLDSDSRSVVAADLNGDGMLDLIVRSNGGGPIHVFENRFPATRWLTVTLRGTRSNSMGIGAKLKLELTDRTLHRELQPTNSYFSQLPVNAHFGLGDSGDIVRLTIRWPSGAVQTIEDVELNQTLHVTEPQ